jgi:hypothetical protein
MSSDSPAGKPDAIVFLESYYEPIAAHLARTRLEAAGIPCFLTNEHLVSLNRLYSHVAGGVRLHVRQRDASAAAELLRSQQPAMAILPEEPAPSAGSSSARRCPRCGSDNVAYGPATHNTYGLWQALLSVFLRYPFRGKRQHCFHCGHEFQ